MEFVTRLSMSKTASLRIWWARSIAALISFRSVLLDIFKLPFLGVYLLRPMYIYLYEFYKRDFLFTRNSFT